MMKLKTFVMIIVIVASATPSSAFDAGSHWDITSSSLQDLRFSNFATKTARYENWLVDYYSAHPFEKIIPCEYLHFDNLPTTMHVRAYWGYFTNNSRRAFQKAASEDNAFKALCLLGMTLHAVQDFYTHSNWCETHLPAAGEFRTDTWWNNTPGPNENSIFTGLYPNPKNPTPAQIAKYHGSYTWGINHDNLNRPNWPEAYVFGYAASVEWVLGIKQWVEQVRPGFYDKMRLYNDPKLVKTLNDDLLNEYYLSMWTYDYTGDTDADGRWKAFGSGSIANFGPLGAAFISAGDNAFTLAFKAPKFWFLDLVGNLNKLDPAVVPTVVPAVEPLRKARLNRRAIIVKTLTIKDDTILGIDFPFDASYYAFIRVADQQFIETVRRKIAAGPVDWMTIKMVPQSRTSMPIGISVYNDSKKFYNIGDPSTPDPKADINPVNGKLALQFTFAPGTEACSGDVSGVANSPTAFFTKSGGEGNKATITFYVTQKVLKE